LSIPFTRRWRTARKYNAIRDEVVRTFDAQYKLLAHMGKGIEAEKGINNRALGYLGGFIQSAMRVQLLDAMNQDAFATFASVYEKLWGKRTGSRYFAHWIRVLNDEEARNGRAIGIEDYWHCMRTKQPPVRWVKCFAD
jgi:hypothetical protein